MNTPSVAAVDLGATSGRVILGRIERSRDGSRIETRHIARFANDPVRTRDGLHWNLLGLYQEVLRGLAASEREMPGGIASVGIDSWAVDYGLLRDGRLLGVPYHYRDARNEVGVAAVHAQVPADVLYARNGLQHLPFNTLFQLATEGPLIKVADRMLLIPDLLAYWLTGAEVAERTNASTTGFLGASTGEWDLDLADALGVPTRILPALVDPGTPLGALSAAPAALVEPSTLSLWPRTTRHRRSRQCRRLGRISRTSRAARGGSSALNSTAQCSARHRASPASRTRGASATAYGSCTM